MTPLLADVIGLAGSTLFTAAFPGADLVPAPDAAWQAAGRR